MTQRNPPLVRARVCLCSVFFRKHEDARGGGDSHRHRHRLHALRPVVRLARGRPRRQHVVRHQIRRPMRPRVRRRVRGAPTVWPRDVLLLPRLVRRGRGVLLRRARLSGAPPHCARARSPCPHCRRQASSATLTSLPRRILAGKPSRASQLAAAARRASTTTRPTAMRMTRTVITTTSIGMARTRIGRDATAAIAGTTTRAITGTTTITARTKRMRRAMRLIRVEMAHASRRRLVGFSVLTWLAKV